MRNFVRGVFYRAQIEKCFFFNCFDLQWRRKFPSKLFTRSQRIKLSSNTIEIENCKVTWKKAWTIWAQLWTGTMRPEVREVVWTRTGFHWITALMKITVESHSSIPISRLVSVCYSNLKFCFHFHRSHGRYHSLLRILFWDQVLQIIFFRCIDALIFSNSLTRSLMCYSLSSRKFSLNSLINGFYKMTFTEFRVWQ